LRAITRFGLGWRSRLGEVTMNERARIPRAVVMSLILGGMLVTSFVSLVAVADRVSATREHPCKAGICLVSDVRRKMIRLTVTGEAGAADHFNLEGDCGEGRHRLRPGEALSFAREPRHITRAFCTVDVQRCGPPAAPGAAETCSPWVSWQVTTLTFSDLVLDVFRGGPRQRPLHDWHLTSIGGATRIW
jgi:hypothetical protein